MRSSRIIKHYRLSQNEAFPLGDVFDDMSRMGRRSFRSLFDVRWYTFDKNLHEKMIFTFSLPPLTFRPHILNCSTKIVQSYVSTKLEVPTTFLFGENGCTGRTNGQDATLNVAPRDGRVIMLYGFFNHWNHFLYYCRKWRVMRGRSLLDSAV